MTSARGVLFFTLARWLPASYWPGGSVFRTVRSLCAGSMLDSAGRLINIEHGAYFGSGRGVSVGDRSGIGVNCRLHGSVNIGSDVMMGPDVVILGVNHEMARTDVPISSQGYTEGKSVSIGNDVWIGTRAIILPGVRIGNHAVVGAGAVVTKDVPSYAVVAGNPARVLRMRDA